MKKLIILFLFCSFEAFGNNLPELGSSFDSLISNVDEKKIKFQIMSQIYKSNSIIRDPEINDYLNNLGNELISKGTVKKPEVNFFIINDSSINAFAMLGNIIGVHSGLLYAAKSESELASVISHEIAHITQKHLLRLIDTQSKNSYKSYLALAVALLVARSSPQIANAAIATGSASQIQNTLDYTRDNEREADRIGLKILNDSGYDPRGFIDFFNTMQKFNNFSSGAAPAFLRTHPVTTERISDIQDRINYYTYLQKNSTIEFFLVKAKLQALLGEYSSVVDIFKNNLNMETYFNKSATYFGLIYALMRQNKTDEAIKYFEQLKSMKIQSPMILELNAQILIKQNKLKEAFDIYKQGINKYPLNKTFVYGISKLLLGSMNFDKAIELLSNYLVYYKNDPYIYELLAKAYNQKGDKLREHENLSDFFYYQFNIKDAISQMDLAVRQNSDDHYEQSRVEYRIKELQREEMLMNN